MKTLKKALLATTVTSTFLFFALGSMNSIVVDKNAFLKNDLNIKFAKRLDDINGVVVTGRMAASLPKFDLSKSLDSKNEVKSLKKVVKAKSVAKKNEVKAIEEKEEIPTPAPAVAETASLELTGGFYQKRSLKGSQFSGSVKVSNGVLEGLTADLPDGKTLSISVINQEMVGNVFQYEDSETREIKSGLFYAVNKEKGEYMLNLTDDTNFGGIRLEFKDPALKDVGTVSSNWKMNSQNVDEQNSEYAQDMESDRDLEQEGQEEQEDNFEQELDENYAQVETQESYAFAF